MLNLTVLHCPVPEVPTEGTTAGTHTHNRSCSQQSQCKDIMTCLQQVKGSSPVLLLCPGETTAGIWGHLWAPQFKEDRGDEETGTSV